MELDRRGLALSTGSAEAAARYRAATELFLLGLPGASDAFAAAAAVDPSCTEAHVGRAFAALFEGDLPTATDALRAAGVGDVGDAGAAGTSNDRARGQAALVRALSELDLAVALNQGRAHLSRYPRDELAREAVGLLLFLLGQTEEIADLYDWLAPQQDSDWSFAASWSFACHEAGRLDQSRDLGHQALAAHPDDTFAVHSLTHVAYESGQHADGLDLVRAFLGATQPIAFQQRHLQWHLALHLLATGDTDGARSLWATAVAPDAVPATLGAVEDGASLLWRWHLYELGGWDLPWSELGALARDVAERPVTPLPAACAAVTLAALGDDDGLATLLANADGLAASGLPVPAPVLAAVAVAARASFAGAWADVADALMPVRDRFGQIGGSRAQREVFDDALLYGLIRGHRHETARALLDERLARRPSAREAQLLASLP
jgi:tetratricopeptide (TPR) repeat protein